MSKYYSLRIPEPCHEDWSLMTPSDKGRFCSSCDKTVIDFTVMNDYEIKDFLLMTKGKKLCGHVKKSQLDLVHIKISVETLSRYRLGHRSFLLALLVVMGTTLMSCKDDFGNKQKIDQVEVVDSLKNADNVIPVKGDLYIPPPPVVGKIVELTGFIDPNYDIGNEVPFSIVDVFPQFPNTPEDLTPKEMKIYFQTKIKAHLDNHFNTGVDKGIEGRQKIETVFTIDKSGHIVDIKVKASSKSLEKETRRVLNLLPNFTPGEQNGEVIPVIYALPITFDAK